MDVLELLEEIDRLDEPYYKGYICKYDVQDIIRNHFLDARKMVDGWIPVEDRLPEKNKTVLVCQRGGVIEVAWHDGYRWKTGFSHAEWLWDVVAWRPMPEPYRPEDIQEASSCFCNN